MRTMQPIRTCAIAAAMVVPAAVLVPGEAVGGSPLSSLSLSWPDGSRLAIAGKTYVWCGKWDDGAEVRTLRLQQGSPLRPPWWSLEVRLTDARRGRRITFPVLVGRRATIFVSFPRRHLEASTDSERSRGSLRLLSDVSCRPGWLVRFSVAARIASEYAGGISVYMRGTFTGRVGRTTAPGVQP
jgi:hypothetical protein